MMVKFERDGVTYHVNTSHVFRMIQVSESAGLMLHISSINRESFMVKDDDGSIARLISNAIGVHVEPVAEVKPKQNATAIKEEGDEITYRVFSFVFAMYVRCMVFAKNLMARVDVMRARFHGDTPVESKPKSAITQPDGGQVHESMYRKTIRFLRGTKEGK